MIDAARRQKVPHITFSALVNFGDKFPVPHCDSKVKSESGANGASLAVS